ncbi:MAG: DoxX family protein [Planctomycetes bacterium]|nr:DoxX family protein [Planctomycetota bacterium]
MKHFVDLVAAFSRLPIFLSGQTAILLTRLILGLIFIGTGWGKLSDFPHTVENFTNWGFVLPGVNAAMAGLTELIGGILLVAGLGTRIGAAMLAGTMAVAMLTVHRAQVLAVFHLGTAEAVKNAGDLTDIVPVVYLLFMLWLIGYGGGKLAFDRLVEIWWARHCGHPPAKQA